MIGSDTATADSGYLEGLTIDLTPLLDIMFLLLIFFVLTANSVQQALQLDLPEEGSEQAAPLEQKAAITLALYKSGPAWGIDEQRFDQWEAFRAALSAAHAGNPELKVVIAGDRQVPMERLLQLLALLKEQGLSAARILMGAGGPLEKPDTTGREP
jgi:biopolymer transport protein ExbD